MKEYCHLLDLLFKTQFRCCTLRECSHDFACAVRHMLAKVQHRHQVSTASASQLPGADHAEDSLAVCAIPHRWCLNVQSSPRTAITGRNDAGWAPSVLKRPAPAAPAQGDRAEAPVNVQWQTGETALVGGW